MSIRKSSLLELLLSAALVSGCASHAPVVENKNEEPVARYLAWMDGDIQTGYRTDRKAAEGRLQELEGKVPESGNTDAYLEYLSVLDAAGRTADAEKKIKKYLSEHPGESRAVFLLGVHYLRIEKKELAGYFFNQLDKDVNFPWKSLLYNDLGMMALNDKNRLGAIGYFEKATKATPRTPAPYVNLGALYLQSRSYAEAEKLFTVAYQIDSDMEDAALGYGVSLEGQGKVEEAHKIYGDFIAAHPNALSVLYNDSIVLGNRLKRREEAAQQLLRYIQRGGKETARAHEIIQSWR
jgi:tetratricopeptide (TPR) repeat protein